MLCCPVIREYPYIVIVPATNWPVSLDMVKTQLKISLLDTSQDTFLELLIDAATQFAEKYTGRDLITKTYLTYRPCFSDYIELHRSMITSIVSFEYLLDGVLTPVDISTYKLLQETGFARIALNVDSSYPSHDTYYQAIKITFDSGFGASEASIPADLKIALLNHIAFLYVNRGDCGCADENNLPVTSKAVYDMYKILMLWGC